MHLSTRRVLLAAPAVLARSAGAVERAYDPAGPRLDRAALVETFVEEFDSFSHSETALGRWRTVLGYGGMRSLGNRTFTSSGQRQIFVSSEARGAVGNDPLGLDPFRVDNGVLSIEASRTPPHLAARLWNYPYVSGLITTKFSFVQTYGHFEARLRLPAGRGFWPAFWLLRRDNRWPPEIDVMEMHGHNPRRIYLALHSQMEGQPRTEEIIPLVVPDTSAGFHLYGVSWQRDWIIWYFDEVEVWRRPTPPDLHEPMFLLLNLSVGGRWPGDPDRTTPLPAAMQVDMVRAYRFRG